MAYDQAKADRICDALASGSSLRKAAEAEAMSHATVLRWVRENEAFADQYARAREAGSFSSQASHCCCSFL